MILFKLSGLKIDSALEPEISSSMHKLTKDFSLKYNWELPAIWRRNNNFLISTITFCMNSKGLNLDLSLKMLPSGQLLNREHNILKLQSRK